MLNIKQRFEAVAGAMPHPELLPEEQVKLFLKLLFHRDSTRQLIEQIFAGTGTEKEDTE